MNFDEFYYKLYTLDGISPIWRKTLDMLKLLQNNISDDALIVFCIYFSLIDDGNTCMRLEFNGLKNKMKPKWNGLVLAKGIPDENKSEFDFDSLDIQINKGINDILSNKYGNIICDANLNKLFVIDKSDNQENWLFTTKYFLAVTSVSDRLSTLLKQSLSSSSVSNSQNIADYFKKANNNGFKLNDEQVSAIVRGQNENLIICGGPGTGKTTVVCYLLWKLFEDNKNGEFDFNLYLAAPSGKAQDRLKESIIDELNGLLVGGQDCQKKNKNVYEKLMNASSYTIHRLLSFNPSANSFAFNKNHQFDAKSVFVIDEASMIDICLFQSLLEAIPDGARVFILGDPFQLPSVQAGAVLGDVIENNNISNRVELKTSNRFDIKSEVGALATNIKNKNISTLPQFNEWDNNNTVSFDPNSYTNYSVEYISLNAAKQTKKKQLESIAKKWVAQFYNYNGLYNLSAATSNADLDTLWAFVTKAKVLCVQHDSLIGVDNLNKLISEQVKITNKIKQGKNDYFLGQQLIVTQNQKMYDLNNGDCGIVVKFTNDKTMYFMIHKIEANGNSANTNANNHINGHICRIGDYMFYPLSILNSNSIDTAFAMTVHKSQGSGYENIMIFLPDQPGHPLLNNQIVYTAVTRTKKMTYMVANQDALRCAIETKISRDTKIIIK